MSQIWQIYLCKYIGRSPKLRSWSSSRECAINVKPRQILLIENRHGVIEYWFTVMCTAGHKKANISCTQDPFERRSRPCWGAWPLNLGNLSIRIHPSSRQCSYPVLVSIHVHSWSQHGTHRFTKEALLSGWLDFKRTQCIAPEVVNLLVGSVRTPTKLRQWVDCTGCFLTLGLPKS